MLILAHIRAKYGLFYLYMLIIFKKKHFVICLFWLL